MVTLSSVTKQELDDAFRDAFLEIFEDEAGFIKEKARVADLVAGPQFVTKDLGIEAADVAAGIDLGLRIAALRAKLSSSTVVGSDPGDEQPEPKEKVRDCGCGTGKDCLFYEVYGSDAVKIFDSSLFRDAVKLDKLKHKFNKVNEKLDKSTN